MEKYVAFLQGINVGGKNKVPMAELKKEFEKWGFTEVKTYLNSGNVIFLSVKDDLGYLKEQIEVKLEASFGFEIPVLVITKARLEDILNHAPDWWGTDNKEIYDNLIFILAPATFSKVYDEIGEPKKELEKIENYDNVIFWSFNRKEYRKTNWWQKTASIDISNRLTIRTANTIKKIVKM